MIRTIAACLVLAVATPAAAGTLYHWRAEDGSYAYTDDARRIPDRYKKDAQASDTSSLADYDRFTPADTAAVDSYAQGLQARLDDLRARNAPVVDEPTQTTRLSLRTSSGEPVVEFSSAPGEAPIVVEKRRVKIDDARRSAKRSRTVIRQGDRVIAVVEDKRSSFDSEDEFYRP